MMMLLPSGPIILTLCISSNPSLLFRQIRSQTNLEVKIPGPKGRRLVGKAQGRIRPASRYLKVREEKEKGKERRQEKVRTGPRFPPHLAVSLARKTADLSVMVSKTVRVRRQRLAVRVRRDTISVVRRGATETTLWELAPTVD